MRSSDTDGGVPLASELEERSPEQTGGIMAVESTRKAKELGRVNEGRRLAGRIERLHDELLAFGVQPYTLAPLRHLARVLQRGQTPLRGVYVISRHHEDRA